VRTSRDLESLPDLEQPYECPPCTTHVFYVYAVYYAVFVQYDQTMDAPRAARLHDRQHDLHKPYDGPATRLQTPRAARRRPPIERLLDLSDQATLLKIQRPTRIPWS
jgi:hypothetical protein